MNRKHTRAVSLIEVMIVMFVIAILTATLWFIFSPLAKRKGLEARVTSDLKQINMAIQIYKMNHDDLYPFTLESMPELSEILANAPHIPDGSPLKGGNQGACPFKYTMGLQGQLTLLHMPVPLKYDPSQHSIVKYTCLKRKVEGMGSSLSLTNQGWVQTPVQNNYEVLSAYETGSVRYAEETDEWHDLVYHFGTQVAPLMRGFEK